MTRYPSPARRDEILSALRQGTVPRAGLASLAVGLDRLVSIIDEELDAVERPGSKFKAIRADYGGGKTFATRWIAEHAKERGFVVSEVQISATETPLYQLGKVYRRIIERLSTAGQTDAALPGLINGWLSAIREQVIANGVPADDPIELQAAIGREIDRRLKPISATAPMFATALRSYHGFVSRRDSQLAEGALAWLGAQPNVPAEVTRAIGVKGAIDHSAALTFLEGFLLVLRDAGRPGLVVILDELETLQRARSDVQAKSYNALRQLLDEQADGRFPGLYLLITGTPDFFDGRQGIERLAPLKQRLHTTFRPNPKFDNLRAPQVRLQPFDLDRLVDVGVRVRDLYAHGTAEEARIRHTVDDGFIAELAKSVAGKLGGQAGIAPRLFLRQLVDELDAVEQHADYDPRVDGAIEFDSLELTIEEREALSTTASADAIELDLPSEA